MNKTIIVTIPSWQGWGSFKLLCKARGWKYQTLNNRGYMPRIGHPVTIEGEEIHRIEVMISKNNSKKNIK